MKLINNKLILKTSQRTKTSKKEITNIRRFSRNTLNKKNIHVEEPLLPNYYYNAIEYLEKHSK